MFKITVLSVKGVAASEPFLVPYSHIRLLCTSFISVFPTMESKNSLTFSTCDLTSREYDEAINSSSLYVEFNQNICTQ